MSIVGSVFYRAGKSKRKPFDNCNADCELKDLIEKYCLHPHTLTFLMCSFWHENHFTVEPEKCNTINHIMNIRINIDLSCTCQICYKIQYPNQAGIFYIYSLSIFFFQFTRHQKKMLTLFFCCYFHLKIWEDNDDENNNSQDHIRGAMFHLPSVGSKLCSTKGAVTT